MIGSTQSSEGSNYGGNERMLTLHIIQAEYGDCLILEYGIQPNPKYILIDGGPQASTRRIFGPGWRRSGRQADGSILPS